MRLRSRRSVEYLVLRISEPRARLATTRFAVHGGHGVVADEDAYRRGRIGDSAHDGGGHDGGVGTAAIMPEMRLSTSPTMAA